VSEFYGIDTDTGVARVHGRGENELCVTSIPEYVCFSFAVNVQSGVVTFMKSSKDIMGARTNFLS
jgi:hypothetical protein